MWRRRSRRQEEEISITVIERGQPGIKLHRPAVARHIHHVHHTRWRPPSHGVLIPVSPLVPILHKCWWGHTPEP